MAYALAYLYAASAKVYPFVPILYATSSTGTTASLLWNAIPKAMRIFLIVVILVGVAVLAVFVVKQVQKMKKAFSVEEHLKKRKVPTEFAGPYVDWLIEQSKQLSKESREAYEARDKSTGMSKGAAAASYLWIARWLMPERTRAKVPKCDDMIALLDDALKHRIGRGVPTLEIVRLPETKK